MRFHAWPAIFVLLALTFAVHGQAPSWPPQNSDGSTGSPRGPRDFGSLGVGPGIGNGRGIRGVVSEVASDHFKVKTEDGQIFIVYFSVNTRIMKQPPESRGPRGGMRRGGGEGAGGGFSPTGTPPQTIKATDIKVGDTIGAMGEMDQAAKSIGAVVIVQVDPEVAKEAEKRFAEMRANYGKTWIQGKVTAVDGVKVTLLGTLDQTQHSFVADENTTFRKRREPITLVDIAVGDTVRADGALKNGVFTATTVNVMGLPPGGMQGGPRNGPAQ